MDNHRQLQWNQMNTVWACGIYNRLYTTLLLYFEHYMWPGNRNDYFKNIKEFMVIYVYGNMEIEIFMF